MSHDPIQISLWNQRLQDCVASGISVRAYCRRESIASSTFYAWRKYFSDKAFAPAIAPRTTQEPAYANLAIAEKKTIPVKPITMVPVTVTAARCDIALRSPAGWQITIAGQIDLPALTRLLQQLP
ncbi:transposase-like protein [Undibacterium sp. GrIS 1.2]|uniref:IS66 family insertion sequence element accessory protein TnpA n=1 Tax=Undibacterium sp. GrIS 1.2 TaxID=3143933 RepID=UPI003399E237